MKVLKLAVATCLAAIAVATPAAAQRGPNGYSSITVFGDSLVDAGNIRRLGLGANPAQGYFMGRFTNGYDYPDLLSLRLFGAPTVASLNGGTNFAYGGARATTTSLVPDLTEQLVQFDARRAAGLAVDAGGLYVLNFGGNDIFAAAQPGAPTGYASDEQFLRDAANTYAAGVQGLADRGARTILITGFPNATVGPQLDATLQAEGYLTDALAALNLGADTTLYRFDYLGFFQRLQADPGAFGLPEPLILPPATCQAARALPDCTGFFSFDGVHPTAAIQRAAYLDMVGRFGLLAGVPEPATWGLMIVGVGAMGGALRRSRRQRRVSLAA